MENAELCRKHARIDEMLVRWYCVSPYPRTMRRNQKGANCVGLYLLSNSAQPVHLSKPGNKPVSKTWVSGPCTGTGKGTCAGLHPRTTRIFHQTREKEISASSHCAGYCVDSYPR
ncbi:hypothetical protein Ddye_023537 [Dipteronia dyeriana]|uniref:Uncharacterized protein n=1 Tax=Dipteronia dyeriana TaxID=168575 RepID=A0AAD9WS70_9ROSI|nr:hypothetical protein Ddye_023537 [Dipteronia dyeriana]